MPFEHKITAGPSLLDLFRSHQRHTDNPVFCVDFKYKDKVGGCLLDVFVQGLERPREGKDHWKIRAFYNNDDTPRNYEYWGQVNVQILYDPTTRKGWLSHGIPDTFMGEFGDTVSQATS